MQEFRDVIPSNSKATANIGGNYKFVVIEEGDKKQLIEQKIIKTTVLHINLKSHFFQSCHLNASFITFFN